MDNIIIKSKNRFGEIFDFSNIKYVNTNTKIKIKCNVHNIEINILPFNHISQKYGGCSLCRKNDKNKIQLNKNEILKDVNIVTYKNLYFISSHGRCFSKRTNKELSSRLNSGYKVVGLWNDEYVEKEKLFIHYLVYISFKNDYNKNNVIDHIDGNKLNNNTSNLRCITQSENIVNAYKNNYNMNKQEIIQAFDKNNILIKEFDKTIDAMNFINHKNRCSIYNCLKGITKTAGGYIWKYKDNNNKNIKNNIDNLDGYINIGLIDDNDFSNYYINKEGKIINNKYKNRSVKLFTNANGYEVVYLYFSNKEKKHFRVHRLLGKLFLKNGNKYYNDSKYVVNHTDENKKNNKINNLEWVTYKENTNHSCAKKVAKIDINTNKIIKIYNSITDAYKDIGQKRSSLISKVCIGKEKGRKTIYGFKWKYVE